MPLLQGPKCLRFTSSSYVLHGIWKKLISNKGETHKPALSPCPLLFTLCSFKCLYVVSILVICHNITIVAYFEITKERDDN